MYTSSIVKVHVLYMYVYDEKLASLYFYLLIVRRVLHGMPRSAFIASDASVGTWITTSPLISSKTLERSSGEQDFISWDN